MTVNRSDFQRRFKAEPDSGDRFIGMDTDDGSGDPFITDLAGMAGGLAPLIAVDTELSSRFVRTAVTGADTNVLIQTDGTDDTVYALEIKDNASTNGGRLLQLTHYGNADTQSYALNISNRSGAGSAAVIHNYSDVGPSLIIDNTRSKAAIYIRNTENETLDPGGFGTGDYLDLYGGSAGDTHRLMRLTKDLAFMAYDTTKPVTFSPQVAAVGLSVSQAYGAVALSVSASSGAAGFYVASLSGYDYGPKVSTSQNSGVTLIVQKDGTGAGTVQQIINKGTGLSLDVRSGSASLFALTSAGLPQWVAAGNQQATVGAAGGASALPATPTKYLKVVDSAGTTLVVPAYAAS